MIRELVSILTAAYLAAPTIAGPPTCTIQNAEAYGAGDGPQSVAVGDLDGDLDLDLVVANSSTDNVSVLLNNGDGTFAADVTYGAGDYPVSIAVADLDGDLDLDLVVANFQSDNVSILRNAGNGTFAADVTYGAGSRPQSVAVADLDGDLDLDLAVANRNSDNVSILLNAGNGTFAADVTYGAGDNTYSVAVGDLDGDLDLDLAVANANSGNVSIFLNDGDGTFAADVTYGVEVGAQSVAIGDLDGDLDLDLVVANSFSSNISILLNDGDGTFAADVTYGAGSYPQSVAVADVDGDLDLDVAVANRTGDDLSILLNNGDGTFAADVLYGAGNAAVSLAIGDLDGDLDLDLAVANNLTDDVSILLNDCTYPLPCPADLDGSGEVDFADLLALLFSWGPCPLDVAMIVPGDDPYLCETDSPWAAMSDTWEYSYREDFEDGLLDSPGLSASAGVVNEPGASTDSIDCDGNGVIDGSGTTGFGFFVQNPDGASVTFSFDEAVLGNLPTRAGLVWTDGNDSAVVTFEAFDGEGALIDSFGTALGDGVHNGSTAADRFLGVEAAGGISAIRLSASVGSVELDHVQYGYVCTCSADINGDCEVAFNDLLALLFGWGPCP